MAQNLKIKYELLQPWSTFVMVTNLPPLVLKKMIKISDEIVENKKSDSDNIRPGQIKDQFFFDLEILQQEDLLSFFLEVCKLYTVQAFCQFDPLNTEKWLKEEWSVYMREFWMVSQKDNEYNPIHDHGGHLSAIMYLKIPEYLPNRKHLGSDGQISFIHNSSKDTIWGTGAYTIEPKVGNFFIFPASMCHLVYPFRTADGKGERRSASFNASFSSKTEQDLLKKNNS